MHGQTFRTIILWVVVSLFVICYQEQIYKKGIKVFWAFNSETVYLEPPHVWKKIVSMCFDFRGSALNRKLTEALV